MVHIIGMAHLAQQVIPIVVRAVMEVIMLQILCLWRLVEMDTPAL